MMNKNKKYYGWNTLTLSDSKTHMSSQNEIILGPGDPDPVSIYNEQYVESSPVLLLCDHASNIIPQKLGTLGLTKEILNQHIALDIGTDIIGPYLSNALKAPIVMAGFSRLVVDLNREPNQSFSIPKVSDNIQIPANCNLSETQKKTRITEIYTPYHQCIANCLDRIKTHTSTPLIVSIHSFTPVIDGEQRDTEIGILWDKNETISKKMIDHLSQNNPGLIIGNNAPYSLKKSPTLNHTINNLPLAEQKNSILVEFRQDLIKDDAGAKTYADIFLQALQDIYP